MKKGKNTKGFKDVILADLSRIDVPTIGNLFKWYFMPKGNTFPYIFWFRALQFSKKKTMTKYTIGLISYLMYNHMTYKYGIHLNSNIDVGPGLLIYHGNGVYLNCKSIGANFSVYQCVTLGSADIHSSRGPKVDDNVTVYTGAVVTGDICLHKGVIVAANSFVNKDVPRDTLVGGVPAKFIKKLTQER